MAVQPRAVGSELNGGIVRYLLCLALLKPQYWSGVSLELDDTHNVNGSFFEYIDHR